MAVAASKRFTLAEYAQLPDDGTRRELDEGELVMMTFPNLAHSRIAMRLAYRLGPWVEDEGLGEVLVEAAFVLRQEPAILRAPDAASVRAERGAAADEAGWIEGSPDLAVEVVSPSDRAGEMNRKIRQYLEHGSQVVMTIYPTERTVRLYRESEEPESLGPADTLEIADLFPGWSMRVAELF